MSRKSALGRDPYAWIGELEPSGPDAEPIQPPEPTTVPGVDREPTRPKYLRMQKVDALLRPEQVAALDRLVREIMSHRADKRERITRNTLIRVAVEALLRLEFSPADIPTEEALQHRVLAACVGGARGPGCKDSRDPGFKGSGG